MTTAAVSSPAIPIYKVEVRRKGEGKKAPWTLFGVALSDHQATEKVTGYEGTYGDFDFRAVPNDWAEEVDASATELEIQDLRDWKKQVVESCGTDDVGILMAAVHAARELPELVEQLRARANKAEDELQALLNPQVQIDAMEKCPFAVGDTVRDKFTEILVKVTAVDRDAQGGDGFDFEMPGGDKGHCPAGSVAECYEAPKKAHAHPHHVAHKAPVHTPAKSHAHPHKATAHKPAHGKRRSALHAKSSRK